MKILRWLWRWFMIPRWLWIPLCQFNFRWIPRYGSTCMFWFAVVTVVFGLIGFALEYCEKDNFGGDPFVPSYQTLQLFLLNSGDEHGPLLAPLTIARISVSLAFLLFSWTVISTVGWDFIVRSRRRRLEGHMVICGLGRIGKQLVDLFAKDQDTVVIESSRENVWLGYAQEKGMDVLHGDSTSTEVLQEARVAEAGVIYIAAGNDQANFETAAAVAALIAESKSSFDPMIYVHLIDPALEATLLQFVKAKSQAKGP